MTTAAPGSGQVPDHLDGGRDSSGHVFSQALAVAEVDSFDQHEHYASWRRTGSPTNL